MSKLINIAFAAAFAVAASTSVHAASNQSEAWSDSQVKSAMDKCKGLASQERARCIVNIRPAGGGGSSMATSIADATTVKEAKGTDEDFLAEIKKCDAANVPDRDRCIADVKDHFGRM